MNTQEIINAIQEKFIKALQSKTNWGTNDLKLLHANIIIEVLAQTIDERPSAGGGYPTLIEQDKYDSILLDGAIPQSRPFINMSVEEFNKFWYDE